MQRVLIESNFFGKIITSKSLTPSTKL